MYRWYAELRITSGWTFSFIEQALEWLNFWRGYYWHNQPVVQNNISTRRDGNSNLELSTSIIVHVVGFLSACSMYNSVEVIWRMPKNVTMPMSPMLPPCLRKPRLMPGEGCLSISLRLIDVASASKVVHSALLIDADINSCRGPENGLLDLRDDWILSIFGRKQ